MAAVSLNHFIFLAIKERFYIAKYSHSLGQSELFKICSYNFEVGLVFFFLNFIQKEHSMPVNNVFFNNLVELVPTMSVWRKKIERRSRWRVPWYTVQEIILCIYVDLTCNDGLDMTWEGRMSLKSSGYTVPDRVIRSDCIQFPDIPPKEYSLDKES